MKQPIWLITIALILDILLLSSDIQKLRRAIRPEEEEQ